MTRSRGVGEASGERVLRGETNFVVSRGRHGLRETEDFFQTAAQHIRRDERAARARVCGQRTQVRRREHRPRQLGIHEHHAVRKRLRGVAGEEKRHADAAQPVRQAEPRGVRVREQDGQTVGAAGGLAAPISRRRRGKHRGIRRSDQAGEAMELDGRGSGSRRRLGRGQLGIFPRGFRCRLIERFERLLSHPDQQRECDQPGKRKIEPNRTNSVSRGGQAGDRKSTRLNSSHSQQSRMPSSA